MTPKTPEFARESPNQLFSHAVFFPIPAAVFSFAVLCAFAALREPASSSSLRAVSRKEDRKQQERNGNSRSHAKPQSRKGKQRSRNEVRTLSLCSPSRAVASRIPVPQNLQVSSSNFQRSPARAGSSDPPENMPPHLGVGANEINYPYTVKISISGLRGWKRRK